MSVTGWFFANDCVDDSSIGLISWIADDLETPLVGSEVSANDNVYAGVSLESGVTTHWLKCTDLGITSSDIPVGQIIVGVEIEIAREGTLVPVSSTMVKICKAGVIQGTDFGDAIDWPSTETVATFGSATELGGLNLSQGYVVSSDFGCGIAIVAATSRLPIPNRSHLIDYVKMRVYYDDPPITNSFMSFFL